MSIFLSSEDLEIIKLAKKGCIFLPSVTTDNLEGQTHVIAYNTK